MLWSESPALQIRQFVSGKGQRRPQCVGMKVLGTPLGHTDFVRNHLERTVDQLLLDRIPMLEDLQSLLVALGALCRCPCQVHDEGG